MIKALIFDFDGLILDTETPEVEVWKAIYAEHGVDYPLESFLQTVGGWGISTFDPAAALSQMTGAAPEVEALRAQHRERSGAVILRQPVLAGVRDYVEAAQRLGLRVAIASSSERAWVEPHLRRLGLLSRFEKIVCGDDVALGRTKPHPDLYLKALAELQIRANEAVVLEDSPNGVNAARAAGIFVVAVPNPTTASLPLDGANLKIRSLADLTLEELLLRVAR